MLVHISISICLVFSFIFGDIQYTDTTSEFSCDDALSIHCVFCLEWRSVVYAYVFLGVLDFLVAEEQETIHPEPAALLRSHIA